MDIQSQKSLIKRFWWVWLVLIFVIVGGIGFAIYVSDKNDSELIERKNKRNSFEWPGPNVKSIVAMFVDLNQIKAISKFRSCAGHDRAGYNFNQVLETDRSMKHYFEPIRDSSETRTELALYAPFDGTIVHIRHIENNPDGTAKTVQENTLLKDGSIENGPIREAGSERPFSGDDFDLMNPLDENAVFGFRHVTPIKSWQLGDQVKAGELIGYALVAKGSNFDIDYVGRDFKQEGNDKYIEALDSVFNHMSDAILAEFAEYGVTPENVIITKAKRDAQTCEYDPVTKYNSPVCHLSNTSSDPTENDCHVRLNKK